ncbi:MBL fold metallo-hydrolase [Elizabethkingia miricola]|uniref:MBL fold metallo-hydrolase n=1 Tax=Elizabethkingia miricola TaxID=172045 RepID=A0ABD5B765_ELIMR|nr:MBL fold metallo-hydrolase [Elizabethkingia miricola]MDQ8749750.1 MBL fold metallo-hydrolase [Elizabethkingia miricola]OPB90164.1 MBL fold metallo-hydrolase [Elizabethkingia miricola]
MKIIPLKEGNFSVNSQKEFVLLENAGISLGLKMAIQPFLIITGKDYILLDAGIGWKESNMQKIFQKLAEAGIKPEQINKILLSHLHKDHISGLVNRTSEGMELNFPDAEIYLQEREYNFALTKEGSPSFDLDILRFTVQHSQLVWMNENSGNITDEISFEVTGGHSPFHQVFWIRENNETAFYGADNLPQSSYFKYHLAYKSDYDGKKALQDRIKWEKQAKEENWKILFYHDMEYPLLSL